MVQTAKRYWSQIDWLIILSLGGAIAFGMVVIASAAHTMTGGERGFLIKQGAGVALGLLVMAVTMSIDYKNLGNWTRELYILNLILLGAVMVAGHTALGAQRWIKIGPIQYQPSETAKVLLIVTLAHFLSKQDRFESWWDMVPAGLFVLLPFGMILLQPDLGTALVLVFILFAMLYVAGMPGWKVSLILLGGIGLIAFWVFAHLHWHIWMPLKDYQINRLIVFLDPNVDPTNTGYHVIQSRIAIGSGGLQGKGWYQGTQSQLGFLPEPHTDFIFAVLAEEFGFMGGAAIIALHGFSIWRLLRDMLQVEDTYGRLIITGVVTMFAFQVVENVGMTLGVMPVAGIPLPFVSYGPTAMVANLWAIGLALGVYMRRKALVFKQFR